MTQNETAKKIAELRAKYGYTLEEVANRVGVGKSTVRKWENGTIQNMGRDKILLLAEALHTTPGYLCGWSDESKPNNVFNLQKRKFRVLGNIACGEPIFADEERELYVELGTSVQADFCLIAKGDSMIGARIHDGDIVFIRQQDMVDNGEIAAVIIDDEATLKRVYYDQDADTLSLFAENPNYRTMRYSGEELNQIRILGKAIAFQSDVK